MLGVVLSPTFDRVASLRTLCRCRCCSHLSSEVCGIMFFSVGVVVVSSDPLFFRDFHENRVWSLLVLSRISKNRVLLIQQ